MNIKRIIKQHALWLDTAGEEGSRAELNYVNLIDVDLKNTNFSRANFIGANFIGANLTGANLYGANLYGANLTRADLTCADLYGANLYGANLYGTIGNLIHLKSIFCETYPITYTAEVIQIGCKHHKIEDWWSFDDNHIIAMDGDKALYWWRTWKPLLQQIIEASPAIPTGYVKRDK